MVCKFMKKRVLPTILLLMLLLILFVGCDLKELFEDNNYSITFVLNNGEDNVVWHKGDAVPSPTMDDYIFDGWFCDKLLEKRVVFDFEKDELSSNLVIYAKWKEKQTFEGLSFENLTVVYDGQPHTIVVDNLPEGAKVEYSTPEQFTDAGEYQISVTVSMYGYKDVDLSATLVIEKAQILGVKFDDLQVVWDGDSHSVEVQGLPNGVSVEYVNNFQTEVGVYDVVAKFDVGNNYLPLDDMNAKLTILEKMCLLTFADGQGEDRSVSVGYGKCISDVPPVRDVVGYTARWNFDINEKIYGDMRIEAVYTPIEYTITFMSMGERWECNQSSFTVEDERFELETPSLRQYVFRGWFDNPLFDGDRIIAIEKGSVGNKTFYAKWEAIEYSIAYDLVYEDATNDVNNPTHFTAESGIVEINAPFMANFEFGGWRIVKTGEIVNSFDAHDFDCDIVLRAEWSKQSFSIQYVLDGGENSEDNPSSYFVGDTDVLQVATKDYYEFVGWFDEIGRKVQTLEGCVGNLTLTARWNAVVYKVNYHNVSESVLPLSNPTQYTVESKDLNLLPPFRDNYIFEGWYDNADFDNVPITKINSGSHGELNLYAKWRAVEYSITYENTFGANLGDNPTTYTVENCNAVIEPIERAFYVFVGWYDENGNNVQTLEGHIGNLILTARWNAVVYKVNYNNVSGSVLPLSNPTQYTVESKDLNLLPPFRDNYIFEGWFDNADFDNAPITKISSGSHGDLHLYAKWRAIEYAITYENTFGANLGNNPTKYTVEDGTLTLEDIMRVGYTFDGWYLNGVKVETVDLTAGGNITLTAKWNAIEYTITYENTFVADLGNNQTTYTVEDGTLTLEDIARVGYTFEGWYLNGVKVETVDFTAGGNILLTAKWNAIEYTITYENTFNANLGNNPTTYTVEDSTLTLEDIARVGYTFDGWYLNGVKVEIVDLTIGGNITLAARWSAIEYTITYENTFGADLGNNPTKYTVADGTLVLENILRAGYSFDGWFLFGNKVETLDLTNGGNIVLVAKWTAIEFSITYELGEGGVNSVDNPSGYCSADAKIVLKNPSRPHYDFVCWKDSLDESVVEEIDCQIAKDVHLVAVWSAHKYSIEYNLNGGEFESENVPTSFTYFDDDIVLPNATKHGYKFIGWFENGNFDGEKVDSIVHNSSQNKSLYAKFEAIKYSITLNDGSGRVISFDIESEEIVLPSAVDKTGYKWLCWTDEDGNRIDSIAPTVLKDVVLTPQYEIVKYTITYSVDGIIVSATPNTYDVENVVTLPTLEKDGFVFDGWYDGDDFENTIVNTSGKVGNLTVYAKWVGRVYNVVYNLDGGENDASNPSTFVFGSESIALKTPKKHGYTFVGWTDVDNNTITVINTSVKGDIVLMANWVETEYSVVYNLDGGVCDNRTKFVYSDCPFALNDAQKEGYNFVGWYTLDGENNKTYVESITDVGDIVLYAEYTKIENVLFEYRYVTENESGAEVDPYYAITKYAGSESEVVIPSTIDGHSISAVESSVFADCIANIEKVVFDEGIKHVQVGIFDGAIKLHTVIFASTLEEMPNGILANCPKLENLTIPYVGQYKYVKGDRNKTLFCFPNLFEQINKGESKEGYASVVNLRVSTDENGNESVIDTGEYVNVIPLTLKNVTVLDGDVFMRAFAYCTMLKAVKFYGNGTYMGEQALRGCTSLEEVHILTATFNEFGLKILAGSGNLAKVIVQNATQKEKLVAAIVSADKIIIES